MRPRLTGLPYLADRATRLGGLPHLSCKHDQIKMRDYMERRVTSPTWGPLPPCKQALNKMANVFFFFPSLLVSSPSRFFAGLSVSFVVMLISRHFITRQKLVIRLELGILRAATCSSCIMTTRMALKVRTDVHNDLLLLILFYSNVPSIYLHLPLGSLSFLSYVTISLLHRDVYDILLVCSLRT